MAQTSDDLDSDQREEGQNTFNVSNPTGGTIQIGDGSKVINNDTKVIQNNNHQKTNVINMTVISNVAVANNEIHCPGFNPGLPVGLQRHINTGECNDEYLMPLDLGISVSKRAALLNEKEPGDVLSTCTDHTNVGQRESGECSQPQLLEIPGSRSKDNEDEIDDCKYENDNQDGVDDCKYGKTHGAIFPTSTRRLNSSLVELAENLCRTSEVEEMEKLVKRICIIINRFSVDNTESCNVQLSEIKLRTYLLQNDDPSTNLSLIEVHINIYSRHLAVMLQHGLQPKESATLVTLLYHLKDLVKLSVYYPTSSLRKDIENVIDMLSIYTAKSNKQQELLKKITKCFTKITCEICFDENNLNLCLKKYLKAPSWILVYLIMSWLKAKVHDDRGNENYLSNFLAVIIYFAKSLHRKNDQSFWWKFTITVVEDLTEIIKQKAEEDLYVCQKSLDALIKFYELLDRKKKVFKVCIEIFYRKARLLLYINNLQVRGKLLQTIFESTDLDTSSQEMTKERLKQSKTLNLTEIRPLHDGSNAVIFLANYKGFLVAAKGSKLSRKCLLEKYVDLNQNNFSHELETLCSLRKKEHPNIIQLIEFDEHLECLLLEYVSFGSLRKFLLYRRSVKLHRSSLKDLILIAVKIAGALDFLEEEGIIHLAMQARNVLIHYNRDVKLTGFQFCRRLEKINQVVGLRNIVLKPHFKWMDRQALLYQSVDPRTVSWSFGVFLYELLTYGCEPYSHIERDEIKRTALNSSEARVYIIRGGKLPKEACIPDSCHKIISERCCQQKYSDRTAFCDLRNLLRKERETLEQMDFIRPPPRLGKESLEVDEYDPGTSQHGDELPYSHLEVIDSCWNRKYSMREIEDEERDDYTNADTSAEQPVLGIMQWNEKGCEYKKAIVVEYMEFKDIKLVEQLQQLDCPELVNVLHVNRFGPTKLEMISESFPAGNIRDAMIHHPALRDNLGKYIPQAGSAVEYLHSQGIVHRNIKLENFCMFNESRIKLGRLGMSVKGIVDPNAIYCDPENNESARNIIGVRWNAPEVLQWCSFTKESDVWSFGVVVWEFVRIWNISFHETLEDVLPYATMSDDQVYKWVTEGNILDDPDPRQLSSHIIYSFICSRCWQWKMDKRSSIKVIVEELNKLLQDSTVWKRSRRRINNEVEQAEIDHMPASNESGYAERVLIESSSDGEYYNGYYNETFVPCEGTEQEAMSDHTPLRSVFESSSDGEYYNGYYNETFVPCEGTEQEAMSDYTPLSERNTETNVYQKLNRSPMNKADDINSDHEITEEETTEESEIY